MGTLLLGTLGPKKISVLILEGCPRFRSEFIESFAVKIWSVLNSEVFLFQRIGASLYC